MSRRLFAFAFTIACVGLHARAGDWHLAHQLECTACHTQHNSANNAPMRTDANPQPAATLLLRDNIEELCLSCHDGNRAEAPDVLAPVTYVADPAGGFFAQTGRVSPMGHDVGSPVPLTPPGGTLEIKLTCTTCHDPHGNANYRNLRPDPTGLGRGSVVVTATQFVNANGTNPSAVYIRPNIIDRGGISDWCSTCHDGTHPNAHPVNRAIFGADNASYTDWSSTHANRTRVDSPTDTDVPSTDDQVTCLSCHKAHGSANPKAVVHVDGATLESTCQQCHARDAFRSTRHGATGSCMQCHDAHGTVDGVITGGPFQHSLFAPNDNELCLTCHASPSAHEIFPGSLLWSQSTHALDPSMFWPGPFPEARTAGDAGRCVNCHNPHGSRDAAGLIPSVLALRQDNLCAGCHDGSRGPDVKSEFAKIYRHPIERSALHSSAEGADETRVGAMPSNNRHAACADCHNPHAPQRVSRVEVINGAAGFAPAYTWRGPDDDTFAVEYEICFKCHSSWTRQPIGQSDLALLTNPANPSFHPIQAQGKNRTINPMTFAPGWDATARVTCTDCHGSDDAGRQGPHGSTHRHLLRKSYPGNSIPAAMSPNDLCFSCHSYEVYADANSVDLLLRASRFNDPASKGHVFHVAVQSIPCYACHDSHGSWRNPALIATGRMPGVNVYLQTSSGGTCTPTCHTTRTYAVNYAR